MRCLTVTKPKVKRTFKPPAEVSTWVTANGNEFDNVVVGIDYQPPEWDTNTAEGVDICYVTHDGRDLYDLMTAAEVTDLESRMLDEVQEQAAADYYDYGDYLHDRRRDDRLTGEA